MSFDRRIVCLHPLLARIAPFPIIRFPDKASNQNQNRDARAGGQREIARTSLLECNGSALFYEDVALDDQQAEFVTE